MERFELPLGWKYKSLFDLVNVIGGVSYSPSDMATKGIRIIRGGNIQDNIVILKDDDVYLPIEYKCEENSLRKGDIVLVASTGSVEALGRTATIWQDMDNVQIGAFLRILRPKEEKYAEFLSATLSSSYYLNYIKTVAKGTSINNISLSHIQGFYIPVPSDEEIQNFSHLYSTIAKKINLNRSINRDLEALAKQIYDYWFVQFDFPDENGRPYKSSGGMMVWNDDLKREIPEGWNNGIFADIANITMGQSPDGSSYNEEGIGSIFYQGSTDFGVRFPSVRMFTTSPSRFAKQGDILMSVRAPVGAVNIANSDCCIGRGLSAINSKIGSITYIYYVVHYLKVRFDSLNTAGTTFGSITKDELFKLPVVVPSDNVIERFESICKPIFGKQMEIGFEMEQLTKQRNELLPLLMNGQVTINPDLSVC